MKKLIFILITLISAPLLAEETTSERDPASAFGSVNMSESTTVNQADPAMELFRGTDLQASHVSETGCPECLSRIGRHNVGEPLILNNGRQFYNLMADEPVSGPAKTTPKSGVKDKFSPAPKRK